ncbi:MAG: outer membrane protein [Firmicutes bacterium]|nr:outer membrane protein [Bacillota bacterium]
MKKKKTYLTAFMLLSFMTVAFPAFAEDTLTLDESINLALNNNEQIQAAASGVEAAKWNFAKAKGEKNMSVNLSHTSSEVGGKYWNVFYLYDLPTKYFMNSVSAAMPIYTGGRIESTIKKAELGTQISELDLENTKQDIKFQTTKDYYDILACQSFQMVREEAVKQLAEHLKNVETQYAVGTATKADMLRSEVELANAKQALITAENNTKKAVSAFNQVIGLPIQNNTGIKDSLTYEPNDYKLDACMAYAFTHRPDELASQKAVKQAELSIKTAEANKKLNVSFNALYGTYDTKIDRFDTKQWMVGVTANINVFDGNITKSGVKSAENLLDQTRHQANNIHNIVELSVQNAYLDMQRAESNILATKAAVAKAKEDFSLAQARYGVNLGTNLDVMDAQVAFTLARSNYIQSLYDYNVSKAELEKAIGKTAEIKD